MEGYGAETYGERFAASYDHWQVTTGVAATTAPAVAALADLAGDGPVLELGIGTGRIALPLRDLGHDVHGIDASEAMVERLRAKPGGADVPVTFGDFADVAVEGDFTLIFVVFNTFFALLDQDAQVRCFANVSQRLTPGGRFVVEAFVPDPARYTDHQHVGIRDMGLDTVSLDVSRHDPAAQRVESHHLHIRDGHIELLPVVVRYAWPSELDLMARLAGLELEGRWGGWDQRPFGAASGQHVSVWVKPAP